MTWFYMDGDQEKGPINKTQLQELINAKQVNGSTLVRNDSTAQWRPLSELMRKKTTDKNTTTPSQPTSPPPVQKAETPASVEMVSTAVCNQCGRSFPKDQVVTFDNQVICAACKPMFVQRLKEGATIAGDYEYAGFWIRFGAKLIDGIAMAICQLIIGVILGVVLAVAGVAEDSMAIGLIVVQQLIGFAIPVVYNTYFIGRFSATLGKMACQIKVVTPEGETVSYARAFGRYFAELVSGLILAIGYIMAAFDDEKRALHDRICSTRVVYK